MRRTVVAIVVLVLSRLALSADVKLSEIMYHPQNDLLEFIELYNAGGDSIDLGGWSFTDGVLYTFPEPTLLPAGSRLLVCRDADAVRDAHGLPPGQLFGDWEGALSNGGESVTLEDDQGNVVESFRYSDEPPFRPA